MEGLVKVANDFNDEMKNNLINLQEFANKRNQQVSGVVDEVDQQQKKLFERSGINMPPKSAPAQGIPANDNNNVTSLFGNQRNRLKAGVKPREQEWLKLDNLLSEIEYGIDNVKQSNEKNLEKINQLTGNKDEVKPAMDQVREVLMRNRDEFGNSKHIQRGMENVEKLKAGNQQLHQRIDQMDGLFNRVGQLDNMKQQIHARNVRQGLIAGGVGAAGLGLAGAYAFNRNKEGKEQ